jgi:hypothetical protein
MCSGTRGPNSAQKRAPIPLWQQSPRNGHAPSNGMDDKKSMMNHVLRYFTMHTDHGFVKPLPTFRRWSGCRQQQATSNEVEPLAQFQTDS